MRTITLGRKGWIVLGVAVLLFAGGVWAWQAGYMPEIGKFFAAEPPGPPYPLPTLNGLLPDTGPAGTTVTLAMSAPLPPENEGRFTVVFGGTEAPIYRSPEGSFKFLVPPVRPGNYPVALRREASCNTPSPTRPPPRIVMDAGLETATRPPPGCMWQEVQCIQAPCYPVLVCPSGTPAPSCMPLPSCVYEGEVRCAFDPIPGTVYCPLPTRTPTPTPIPPTCYGATVGNPLPFTVTEGQCMPRPACLDAAPSCDMAEPADGWCPTPTPSTSPGGITIIRPSAGGVVSLNNPPYSITWNTSPGLLPSGDVEILLYKRSLGSGGVFYIARGAPNQGWYNWDMTKPVTRATDGSPQDLSVITGSDFFIYISVPYENIWGETGDFSIVGLSPTPPPPPGCYYQEVQCVTTPCNPVLVCVTPTPTRPPTPTPTSNGQTVSMQLLPTDGISPVQIGSPRTGNVTVHVNIFMDIPQRTKVSGVDLHVQSDRKLTMSDFSYGPDFPEVLRGPQSTPASYTENEFSVALGTGPNGGVSGRVLVGTLTVVVAPGAEPELRMYIRDDSTVTAVDSDEDVLGPVGDLWFITGPRSGRPGDLDGDGDVDIFDYNLVVSNFGKQYSQ